MELVLTSLDIDPLPKPRKEAYDSLPEGILNSNYQSIVRNNFKNLNSHSVFSVKQRIKSNRFHSVNIIETIVKVSVFILLLILVFA
jgi:hypothetical protein